MKNQVLTALFAGLLLLAAAPASAQAPKAEEHTEHHPDGAKPPAAAATPGQPAASSGMPGGGGMPMMNMMGGGMPMMNMMGGGMPMMNMMGGGMMAPHQHVEGRLAFLRTELAITAAQEPAWAEFAAAVRNHGNDMGSGMPAMGAAQESGWIARLERHEKMILKHLDGLRAIKTPATVLYGVLGAEQKKIADSLMMGPMGPMGPM